MSSPYVSDFPGSEKVNPGEVFRAPGYTEPRQRIPGTVIALFVISLVSFLVPVYLTVAAIVVSVITGGLLRARRLTGVRYPGDALLRAAFGLSFLSMAWGLLWLLIWAMVTNLG